MLSTDFYYDGISLSSFGCIICDFDSSSGTNTVSAGSEITFNTVATHTGKRHNLTSTQYDSCIQTQLDICKDPCTANDNMAFSPSEVRALMRWLNRKEFLQLRFVDSEDNTHIVYYDESFNIEKIEIASVVYGLRLSMVTDKPFGYGALTGVSNETVAANGSVTINDQSDEIGYLYPDVTIQCTSDGDYQMTCVCNGESQITQIKNCTSGEIINLFGESKIIMTSNSSHTTLASDFNYVFPRIGNTYASRTNTITVNKGCVLSVEYRPIIKEAP